MTEVAAALRLRRKTFWTCLVVILIGSASLLFNAALTDSVTNDEGIYIHSGVCAYTSGVIDLEATNPASFKLLAGAGALASGAASGADCSSFSYRSLIAAGNTDALRQLVFAARIPSIIITLVLIVICALWAAQLGGSLAGVLAAAFVGFDPTVLSSGHIATGDIPLAFASVAALAALWNWRYRGRRSAWLLLCGLAVGFAMLNKASAILLVPLLVTLVLAVGSGGFRSRVIPAAKVGVIVSAVAYAAVVLVYLPFRHLEPDRDLLPAGMNWMLPQSWLWGANWQRGHVAAAADTNYYLNGEEHLGGSLLYFPEAVALKMTIPALVCCVVGVVLLVRRRHPALLWCVLPGSLLFASAVAAGIQIGIRYVAPSIVLFLMAGAVGLSAIRGRAVLAGPVLAVAGIVSVTLATPGYFGYFNALAIGRDSYYLNDSNIDFGQEGWRLREWWEQAGRPEIQVDMFGYLPARYYVPSAIDVGRHGERLDDTFVPDVGGRILITSINSGVAGSERQAAIAGATCYIGTGLVIVGATDCVTGR